MKNSWRTPVGGIATYSIIRLWNKGDKAGAGVGMFLTLIGPVGCFILLCLVILAVVNFWVWLTALAIIFFVAKEVFLSQAIPKYFFNSGIWWENTKTGVKVVDVKFMQENFTKAERVEMQRKFLKALGKYRDNHPNMTLDVL